MPFESVKQWAGQSGTPLPLAYKLKVLAVFGVLLAILTFVIYGVYISLRPTVESFPRVCSQETVYSDLSKITDPSLVCGLVLDLGGRENGRIPPQIFEFPNLLGLRLGGNHLKELPPDIGKLTNLVQLGLRNNELTSLPEETSKLVNLKVLVLTGNNFSEAEKERIKRLLPSTQISF